MILPIHSTRSARLIRLGTFQARQQTPAVPAAIVVVVVSTVVVALATGEAVGEETRSNLPLSEQYRVIAKRWVDQDDAARLLEETKSAVLEERKNRLIETDPKMADSHAERQAKADPEWHEWVKNMVKQRTEANRLKVQLEYIRMRHSEQQSFEATARAEMKL